MTRDDAVTRRAELQIVIGSVLISFSAIFVKMVTVGPTASAVYRNVFGALALLPLVIIRRDALWKERGADVFLERRRTLGEPGRSCRRDLASHRRRQTRGFARRADEHRYATRLL